MAAKVEEPVKPGGSRSTRRTIGEDSSCISAKRLRVNVSPVAGNLHDPTYFGRFITTQYGLIRLVFDYLTWHDLKIVSQVCSDWERVADLVLKDRTDIHWMHWSYKDDIPAEEYVEKFIHTEILSHPKLSVVFLPNTYQAKKKRSKEAICRQVWNELQPMRNFSSTISVLWTDGIVGTRHSNLEAVEIERRRHSLSAFIMPNLPGVAVCQLFPDPVHLWNRSPNVRNDPDELLKAIGFEPVDVKCVLLFVKHYEFIDNGLVSNFIYAIREKQKKKFAVGGGIIEDMFVDKVKDAGVIAIVFSGENVVSSSLVVDSRVTSKEETSFRLQEMNKSNILADKSMGFMFSCLGRGKHWYNDETDVESRLFRQHFPTVPLVGFFGNGEIGWNYFSASPSLDRADITHSYATTFVYLGFKMPKKKTFK